MSVDGPSKNLWKNWLLRRAIEKYADHPDLDKRLSKKASLRDLQAHLAYIFDKDKRRLLKFDGKNTDHFVEIADYLQGVGGLSGPELLDEIQDMHDAACALEGKPASDKAWKVIQKLLALLTAFFAWLRKPVHAFATVAVLGGLSVGIYQLQRETPPSTPKDKDPSNTPKVIDPINTPKVIDPINTPKVKDSIHCSRLNLDLEIKKTKANGNTWDRFVGVPPDPMGIMTIYDNGIVVKRERIARRKDIYRLSVSLFAMNGVTLEPTYTFQVRLEDADLLGITRIPFNGWNAGNDRIGTASGDFKNPTSFRASTRSFSLVGRCVP